MVVNYNKKIINTEAIGLLKKNRYLGRVPKFSQDFLSTLDESIFLPITVFNFRGFFFIL